MIQQNSKFSLCVDRDDCINHIIIKCSKLPQKRDKTRHDWVQKLIQRELSKKLKFDDTTICNMHKTESARKNDIHKILGDFKIQTDQLIPIRWPELVIVYKEKEKFPNSELCRLGKPLRESRKNERKKKRKEINT